MLSGRCGRCGDVSWLLMRLNAEGAYHREAWQSYKLPTANAPDYLRRFPHLWVYPLADVVRLQVDLSYTRRPRQKQCSRASLTAQRSFADRTHTNTDIGKLQLMAPTP
jgi:hypothetical protein